MKRKKKIIIVIVATVLLLILAGCLIAFNIPGLSWKLSDNQYNKMLSNMDIEGIESVVDNSMLGTAYRTKRSSKEYRDDNEYPTIYKELSELCGEQKAYSYYACYGLGKDKTQAETMLEEYIKYLLEQGYEYQSTNNVFGYIYMKGSNIIMIQHSVIGPVHWSDKSEGQYGIYIWYY